MMKAKLLLLLFCLCTVGAMGQGVVTRNKCKTCGKVLSKCVCNKKQKPTPKPKPKPTPKPQPAPEAAGYDVTFACNVSSANLYVDGNANGTASGSHFLKTGQHTIQVTANGYKDYTRVITVNRQNRSFYVDLEKKPMTNRTSRVGNVEFAMVEVDGGTFTMGATSEMQNPLSDEKPTHQVTLGSYSIGETEVTQALWQTVMGSNPSKFKGDNLPVENVSWDDCQEFIRKLNLQTGQRFRLPTEAEWEFAARGGNRSNHTQYSGSSSLDEVAWYDGNSGRKTHPVKTKKANELGLYDMSGNVWEWCQDWYGSYSSSSQYNPTGPGSGSSRVGRGGGWDGTARLCSSSGRCTGAPFSRGNYLGLRLALSVNRQNRSFDIDLEKKPVTSGYSNYVLRVGNVVYNMKRVEGGTFTMGATAEMSEPYNWEKPTHQVTLSSYSIGETEVTQALWQAVMGNNPSRFRGDNLPVEQVSWDDCQTFINKLNDLTGQRFRLPTEAEWEFAARGGNRSNHTRYSGSSRIDEVAWYDGNSGNKTHPVKTKKPNELGIYDMTGNVWEWCQDWDGSYSSSSQYNPTGPGSGSLRVDRGGSWDYGPWDCRSSRRDSHAPVRRFNDLGLRLALSE